MRAAILDTNIYVGFFEKKLYLKELAPIHAAFVVRLAAVVLSELRRGARAQEARRAVELLHRNATEIWEPTADDWWEAGKLIREIGDERTWDVNKRREFQNDALIALTARRHGALVVTANRADFESLRQRLDVRVRYL